MQNLLEYSFKELKNELLDQRIAANRAYPIYGWIYRKSVFDFEEMTDLPKNLRPELNENYKIINLTEEKRSDSSNKDSVKFLFRTEDDNFIESVLLFSGEDDKGNESPDRRTICVSTQVGCALGCAFCATGKLGFTRDLSVSEIISQVLYINKYVKDLLDIDWKERGLTNIVFMGMGEPLLNYQNVMKAIHILNFSGGFNLGMRHFTISTAGIAPVIKQLAEDNQQVRLAVSLNSANHDKRKVLMPINNKYSLKELMKALQYYQDITNRRITFEYVLIDGINDDETDVLMMKRVLSGLKYNLNLIVYNPVNSIPFDRPNSKKVRIFEGYLKKHGIPYVKRFSKGNDISAGCGQLGLIEMNK